MSILNKQIDSDYVDGIKTLVDKSRHTLALIQASGAKTLSKPDVISSVCDHPQRQREYYRDKCYKCWECLKIVVEQTDL